MKYSKSQLGKAPIEPDRVIPFELGYRPWLDGFRGLSILAVMAFNGHLSYAQGGFIGVDLFFVLSGFLITSLLVQEYYRTSTISVRSFYYRRALRLLPALFALLLCYSAYAALFQPREKAIAEWKGVFYTLFYAANWAQIGFKAGALGTLSHAWSLSVEEQFYILWPLILIVLLKVGKKSLIVAVLVLSAVASLAWTAWLWSHTPNYLRMYLGSDTRANELLIGCLTGFLVTWKSFPQSKPIKFCLHVMSAISIVAILYAVYAARYYSGFVYNGGFTLISLGAAVIIIDMIVFPSFLLRIFEIKPLVWIGKISYGLYLWHLPIFEVWRQTFEGRVSPFVFTALRLGSVLLVAATSYYVLEIPFLKLRRRYNQASADETKLRSQLIAIEGV